MKISSRLYDHRIQANNVLAELDLASYADLVRSRISSNPFQRKRVSSSKTVYTLLKKDIAAGCVIPPVVLALPNEVEGIESWDDDRLIEHILASRDELVILDGLQRTYTILDLLAESAGDAQMPGSRTLRVEIYMGINRLGILYRMLTLNTGQTPMSLRQQIEMLYADYQDRTLNSGVELHTEAEGKYVKELNQYVFKDVIDGFNSYLNRDELPLDRAGVLENIKSLEKLATENQSANLFEEFVEALNRFMQRIVELTEDVQLSDEYIRLNPGYFGGNITKVFKRPQSISGLGAALGIMIERELVVDLKSALRNIDEIRVDDPEELLVALNDALLWLKEFAPKIGNAQRSFFAYFFRELLNPDSDSYANPETAVRNALRKYQGQNY